MEKYLVIRMIIREIKRSDCLYIIIIIIIVFSTKIKEDDKNNEYEYDNKTKKQNIMKQLIKIIILVCDVMLCS